jgi:hypothetical protein
MNTHKARTRTPTYPIISRNSRKFMTAYVGVEMNSIVVSVGVDLE